MVSMFAPPFVDRALSIPYQHLKIKIIFQLSLKNS
nr:MAG TPA: hypothetical protein [Caudoviricetes sp.]